ncbi:MAG: hypothetical protein IKW74_04260 [Thermoguttaceae bacterium]|nr:hypothetical protein [Thermoguttaceae bacterium]
MRFIFSDFLSYRTFCCISCRVPAAILALLIGVTSLSQSIAETVDADPPSIPAAKGFTEITSDDVNRAFQNLQPSPRLLLTGDAIANIQKKTADDQRWQEYYEALKRRADQNFDQKPVERIVTGRRLLEISRIALERIFSWSFLYRFTNDEKYAKRVEKEALAIARFEDWNPSHFLDVAEMTTALAIGYDTCKENFSEDNRRIICQAIRDKGVLESLGKNHGWKKTTRTGIRSAGVERCMERWLLRMRNRNWRVLRFGMPLMVSPGACLLMNPTEIIPRARFTGVTVQVSICS